MHFSRRIYFPNQKLTDLNETVYSSLQPIHNSNLDLIHNGTSMNCRLYRWNVGMYASKIWYGIDISYREGSESGNWSGTDLERMIEIPKFHWAVTEKFTFVPNNSYTRFGMFKPIEVLLYCIRHIPRQFNPNPLFFGGLILLGYLRLKRHQ